MTRPFMPLSLKSTGLLMTGFLASSIMLGYARAVKPIGISVSPGLNHQPAAAIADPESHQASVTPSLVSAVSAVGKTSLQQSQLGAQSTSIQTAQARRNGRLIVSYRPVRNRTYQRVQQAYQRSQIFEKLGSVIHNRIALPRDVRIELAECGQVNAFYQRSQHRIIMCYELTDYLIRMFGRGGRRTVQQAARLAVDATVFIFFHEAGHMLIHELDLPITGREEDAADQFSTLLLSRSGEAGHRAVLSAALWMGSSSSRLDRPAFMDAHSLNQQRFYALVCLLYGNQPNRYVRLTQTLRFSSQRLNACRAEYAQVQRSWNTLLKPHIKQSSL